MRSSSLRWLAALLPALLAAGCSLGKQHSSFVQTGLRGIQPDPAGVAAARIAPEPQILPTTRFAAARLFESTRQFDKAIEQYRKAIAGDENYVEAYHRLGILLSYLGQHHEAEKALRRAVQLSPSASALRNNLAFEFILQRRWSEAERELRRAIMFHPDFERARTNLGLVLAAQGRFDDALVEYRRVLPDPDAFYNLGLAYRVHKRYGDARTAFTHVLAMRPNFEAARKQLDRLPGQRTEPVETRENNSDSSIDSVPEDSAVDDATATVEVVYMPSLPPDIVETLEADADLLPVISTGPGDLDNDGDVDADDLERFRGCFSGPGVALRAGCELGDLDQDGDVDLLDYQCFQTILPRG